MSDDEARTGRRMARVPDRIEAVTDANAAGRSGPPYGDTHEERARELRETGMSVRHRGRGILQDLREALEPERERQQRGRSGR